MRPKTKSSSPVASDKSKKGTSADESKPSAPSDPIAHPPGFVPNCLDFTTGDAEQLCTQSTERTVKSLVWGPVMSAAMPCLSLLFMGRAVMFFLSSSMQVVGAGVGILGAAFSANPRLSADNRLTMIAVGLGLLVFVLWRAQAGGMFTRIVVHEVERPPVFFDIQ
jgi:hypothetical protein